MFKLLDNETRNLADSMFPNNKKLCNERCDTTFCLKVVSSEMDLAESRLIR
jgi:hypothetical protein